LRDSSVLDQSPSPGATPERKFCDILSIIIGRIDQARRLVLQNLGAHSIKKGALTFLNSILGGPSAIAIELRADHHIGDVRSGYIFQSISQDMYSSCTCIRHALSAILRPHGPNSHGQR
jgi:hypothetical protein